MSSYRQNAAKTGERIDSLLSQSKEDLVRIIIEKEGHSIPVAVLNSGLHPLQAVVRFLKDSQKLEIKHIAVLLNRNVQTIWTSYRLAKGKKASFSEKGIRIPLDVLFKNKNSILESTVYYLHNIHGMRMTDIAVILGKSIKTVWTCNNRYMIKGGKK